MATTSSYPDDVDPESQEEIEDTDTGKWCGCSKWLWILAIVLGTVGIIMLILWLCGVFSAKSELHNECIVELPVNRADILATDERVAGLQKAIGEEYAFRTAHYLSARHLLLKKADQAKFDEWARGVDQLKNKKLTFKPVLEVPGGESIDTYEALGEVGIDITQRALVVAIQRAHLIQLRLKADKPDEFRKMAPQAAFDEVMEFVKMVKLDATCIVEELAIPTSRKVRIAAHPQLGDAMVELFEFFVSEGNSIADRLIATVERNLPKLFGSATTVQELVQEVQQNQPQVAKRLKEYGEAIKADEPALEAEKKTAGEKFEKLEAKHKATVDAVAEAITMRCREQIERMGANMENTFDALAEMFAPLMRQFGQMGMPGMPDVGRMRMPAGRLGRRRR